MRLIHDYEKIIREEIYECHRRLPRLCKVQMPRIVLNSRAEACLPHHLYVKIGPLCYSLSLYELVLALKILHALIKLFLYIEAGLIYLLLRNYIV